jgi:hypothetical protein
MRFDVAGGISPAKYRNIYGLSLAMRRSPQRPCHPDIIPPLLDFWEDAQSRKRISAATTWGTNSKGK